MLTATPTAAATPIRKMSAHGREGTRRGRAGEARERRVSGRPRPRHCASASSGASPDPGGGSALGRCPSAQPVAAPPTLTNGWARALLLDGSYTNPAGLVVALPAGAWANAGSAKLRFNDVHNTHIHVDL
jgi:hypothetical protein